MSGLLTLGAGFDKELTGRDNILLGGAFLGLDDAVTRELLPSIIEYTELGEFIDAPLRTYSTGMVARLGFSIATDVEPDVLLIDEVLSVGDIGFQQKCAERTDRFRNQGVTFVLVSHSMETVARLCERAFWLEGGRVAHDGPAREVATAFGAAASAPLAQAGDKPAA